jgi:hypothetical protein
MPKKAATADELIWLFHEKLAGSNFAHAKIAIIHIGDGNWSALTNALSAGTTLISQSLWHASRSNCEAVTV